ncbi:hypothetical protein SAMD00019534_112230 [Acytostelium subglobosum LB1]|uniref:hypothetical protein n=1 Tax=Acytostelium subglobosum LB1 TaxID=1410327 RepID=UPI000644D23E|nr:hypothetical protein SAMD00019534_112230 [Acytostelium subglobosum LB1]GAM28047.1 hypothetical protein SAMD00019534_112230 [Acytostelium subglobosum LB1]|eukprot:XP_012749006.1 hypothetical protein SAMD00019534_112230 [Acytostelium subglobosum LB1]
MLQSLLFVTFVTALATSATAQSTTCPNYKVVSIEQTKVGYSGQLQLLNPGPYGADIEQLNIDVYYQSQDILRVRIYDSNNQRWEVPNINQLPLPTEAPSNLNYAVQFNQQTFGFEVLRASNNQVIFNTTSPSNCQFNGLIFEDDYIEISTSFSESNPNLYGLGERTRPLRLANNGTYTLWAKDQGTASELDINTYGSHPFYLQLHSDGSANGVFLLNSNAMDVVLSETSLTYKVVGGILDFFIFVGPTPAAVVQQYSQVIGTPYMPSYWSLGWHQCRWGYHTLLETEYVVTSYFKNGIPLETMWNDIDYMYQYEIFTQDQGRFPADKFTAFIEYLHYNNQHYMMIIDPGVKIQTTIPYPSYTDLLAVRAYITEADGVTPVVGSVWPGPVNFPDWFHPNATTYWLDQFAAFRAIGIKFDGVWIDMNEISNFCNGDCATHEASPSAPNSFNPNTPPYIPGGVPLSDKTLNMTSMQYGNISFYNSHNLFGYMEGVATSFAAQQLIGKRTLVIGRSTFPGSGKHQGHWLGDNDSTYEDMYYSIPGILTMNMFGISMIGADICGFNGNTTAELCARWTQLGCFYPFSRNHNSINSQPQEPYVFGQQVIDIVTAAINLKYTLLPHYYTLFYSAHANGDMMVVRPLFFEYPTDPNTYALDTQFLVGGHLLVSPVLAEGADTVNAYFPTDVWYDYFTGVQVPASSTGTYQTLDAPLDKINVHIRGGIVMPTQPTSQYTDPVTPITLTFARALPYSLVVALSSQGTAKGLLYIDDGQTVDAYESGVYSLIQFNVTGGNTLVSDCLVAGYTNHTVSTLGSFNILGVQQPVQSVTLGGESTPFNYNSTTHTLSISNLAISLLQSFTLEWN